MTKVYKNGKEFTVRHAVDLKEWIADGYSIDGGKTKEKQSVTPEIASAYLANIKTLKAEETKVLADYHGVEYTSIEETKSNILDKVKG